MEPRVRDDQFVNRPSAYQKRPIKLDYETLRQRYTASPASPPEKSLKVVIPQELDFSAPIVIKLPKKSKISTALASLAVVLVMAGAGVCINGLRQNHEVRAQSIGAALGTNGSVPDETKPNDDSLSSYMVPPTEPRLLTIEKLGVKSKIVKLGVDKQGQLGTPNNVYDAGWYKGSNRPADAGGAVLLDGHIAGPTKKGVFYGLTKMQPGDIINIERGDGQKYNFKVIKSQTYNADKVDMNAALVSAQQGKLGLNLISCTGKFDSKTKNYTQRVIVFAVAN